MKREMNLDRIPGRRNSTDAQLAAIEAEALALTHIAGAGSSGAALWQVDSGQDRYFTEDFNFWLKDIAKKKGLYIRKTSDRVRGPCDGPPCGQE